MTAEQLFLGSITTVIGVIIGYILATFNERIKRNRLRYCLLKQLWGDLAEPIEDIRQGASCMMMPQRLSIIESILSSGVLGDDKKYYPLLKELLDLRGFYINYNTYANISNLCYVVCGSNAGFVEGIAIMSQKSAEQAKKVSEEIKKMYPRECWN